MEGGQGQLSGVTVELYFAGWLVEGSRVPKGEMKGIWLAVVLIQMRLRVCIFVVVCCYYIW